MDDHVRGRPPVHLPERRRLRTFAFDPMSTRLTGRFLHVSVPFEHGLKPGPVGELVHVVDYDATRKAWYHPVDLDHPAILAQDGLRPSEGDPRAHQQVVYAVAMSVLERFERFLGRRFRWRAKRALRIVPHAFEGRNAFFDPKRGAVLFGYYRADRRDPGANLPGQVMFTCLSSDVVAHEVAHAIAHRLRRHYAEATNPHVFAWHEAFADLVALFQHFVHRDVVIDAVASTQGDLRAGGGLLDLAREFGESTGRGAALRTAIKDRNPDPELFRRTTEPHELGAHFVAGVFDAYLATYQSRIADLLRIATGGSGVLPPGRLHPDLVERVADEAVRNADRMLGMVVRAFDYLPVVDVTFGDVVRAIVTADRALYPDDGRHLRSELVEALRRRGIFPDRVRSLTDESLAWPEPAEPLSFAGDDLAADLVKVVLAATRDLDVGGAAGRAEPDRSDDDDEDDATREPAAGSAEPAERWPYRSFARWGRRNAYAIGLDPAYEVALAGVHVSYRMAADAQPRPELVVQFTQRRRDLEDQHRDPNARPIMRAGTTLVARVDGDVEAIVAKPLPLSDPAAIEQLPGELRRIAREHHEAGTARHEQLKGWCQAVEDADALTPWTAEPALSRLSFANLHAAFGGGA